MPSRSSEALQRRPLGGRFIEMIGLRIEFTREALDVLARHNFSRASEAHAHSEVFKPRNHQFSPRHCLQKKRLWSARLYANGCIKSQGVRAKGGKKMISYRSRMLAGVAIAVLFVGVHSSRAADFAGSVQGVVKSASGQALSGAYVKLINPERRLTFMLVTQAEGRYAMNDLPPGDDTVQGIG